MTDILRYGAMLAGIAVLIAPFAMGTPEYAKKESKSCTFCHTAVGKPDLNEVGKYYKDHNLSLAGYDENKKKP
jgi:hypothetical protein